MKHQSQKTSSNTESMSQFLIYPKYALKTESTPEEVRREGTTTVPFFPLVF